MASEAAVARNPFDLLDELEVLVAEADEDSSHGQREKVASAAARLEAAWMLNLERQAAATDAAEASSPPSASAAPEASSLSARASSSSAALLVETRNGRQQPAPARSATSGRGLDYSRFERLAAEVSDEDSDHGTQDPELAAHAADMKRALDVCESRCLLGVREGLGASASAAEHPGQRRKWEELGAKAQRLRSAARGACGPELRSAPSAEEDLLAGSLGFFGTAGRARRQAKTAAPTVSVDIGGKCASSSHGNDSVRTINESSLDMMD
eukprot:TRINITY_DN41805_c0_g1_i1.p1 TRINITY_DN41805_c0_g1~~TRINITY_DN41805_c0_g1_i1.p1  ORF type:complete len:269 (-),score=66.23 TRINITY_DN41805_c0_g1_i1:51-857(-)